MCENAVEVAFGPPKPLIGQPALLHPIWTAVVQVLVLSCSHVNSQQTEFRLFCCFSAEVENEFMSVMFRILGGFFVRYVKNWIRVQTAGPRLSSDGFRSI